MVERWPTACVRERGRVVAAGATHVLSERLRVAAIGNLATLPSNWRAGLGRAITARLCGALRARADHVGLNVAVDNAAAIACYTGLGFAPVRTYLEGAFRRRTAPLRSRSRP